MNDKLLNRANFLSSKISRIQNTLNRIEEYKNKNDSWTPYGYFSIDMEILEPIFDIIIESLKDKRRIYSIELSSL
jgi:hypothetical protein